MYSAVVASRKPLGAIDNGINKVGLNETRQLGFE